VRRRQLIREMEEKIAKLSTDLSALLSAKFQEQLVRYEQQLLEVIQPYERFLESERAKLERARTELDAASREVDRLERQISTTFSTPAEQPAHAS
jgi:phage shock protein A